MGVFENLEMFVGMIDARAQHGIQQRDEPAPENEAARRKLSAEKSAQTTHRKVSIEFSVGKDSDFGRAYPFFIIFLLLKFVCFKTSNRPNRLNAMTKPIHFITAEEAVPGNQKP